NLDLTGRRRHRTVAAQDCISGRKFQLGTSTPDNLSRILPKSASREMLMYTKRFLSVALLAPAFGLALAAAKGDGDSFSARLRGLSEVPPVATEASGSFSARLSSDGSTLSYRVTYQDLQAPILFSHIHFGFPKEATGIMVFLCGPASGQTGGPPAGT